MDGLTTALDILADLASIVIVASAIVIWRSGRNPFVANAIKRARIDSVGQVLKRAGLGRRGAGREVSRFVKRRLDGAEAGSVASEIAWLEHANSLVGGHRPVELHGLGPVAEIGSLRMLEAAYRTLAQRLGARRRLGGGTAAHIELASSVAAATADRLALDATFSLVTPSEYTRTGIKTRFGDQMELGPISLGIGRFATIDEICVAHRPIRYVVANTVSTELALLDKVEIRTINVTNDELTRLNRKFSDPDRKTFDSVLPALSLDTAPAWQVDPASGRLRLFMELAEMSFSAVLVGSYVGENGVGRPRERLTGEPALLTMSLLPITSDDYLVLTRRTRHVHMADGMTSSGVTGNLEMRARTGITADIDHDGLPDPIRAICREADEELNLQISPSDVEVLGLGRLDTSREVGTYVLMMAARPYVTFEQMVGDAAFADRVEGIWEIEDEIYGVPRPVDASDWLNLVRWAASNPECVMHAVGSIAAMASAAMLADRTVAEIPRVLAAVAAAVGGDETARTPAGLVKGNRRTKLVERWSDADVLAWRIRAGEWSGD